MTHPSPYSQPSEKDKHKPKHRWPLVIVLIIIVILAVWGILSRLHDSSALRKTTDAQAIPTVAVIQAARSPAEEDVILPGSIQAWHEAPIYARTSGYLKDWMTDIGTRVKEGDLLAEIETPEVDAQYHQAQADLATAQANNDLAQTTAKRWLALLKTNSVSKQDADDKVGAAEAAAANVAAAQANLDRLVQLEGFKRVVAPFDGVVTARNTDTGALINAGSSGTGPELFHIAQTDKLRVYVQVPEIYIQAVKDEMTAKLYLAEYPQQLFDAVLTHNADAFDPTTRTLLIQLEVDNANGELRPGSYAQVHLKLPASGNSVHLPVNTLLFRSDGLRVATVDSSNKVHLQNVTIGRDYGKEVEIIDGVTPDETIVVNPPDSLSDGQDVKIKQPDQDKDKQSGGKGDTKKDDKKDSAKKDGDQK